MRREQVKSLVESQLGRMGLAQGSWSLYASRGGYVLFIHLGGKMHQIEFASRISLKWAFWKLGFVQGYAAGVKAKPQLSEQVPTVKGAMHATYRNGHDQQHSLPI